MDEQDTAEEVDAVTALLNAVIALNTVVATTMYAMLTATVTDDEFHTALEALDMAVVSYLIRKREAKTTYLRVVTTEGPSC